MLRKGGVGVVVGGIVQTQQHQKNVTEEKIQRAKVIIYKTKHSKQSAHPASSTKQLRFVATQNCVNILGQQECQPFTVEREHKHLIMAT